MPPGVGASVVVNVSVGGQCVISHVSYDPPSISSVTPNLIDAVTGGQLVIRGVNFGPSSLSLAATVSTIVTENGTNSSTSISTPCNDLLWVSDSQARCTIGRDGFVARALFTISTANQTASAEIDILCPRGFYGGISEKCVVCPLGATCAGMLANPMSIMGFWREDRITFVPCKPPYACTGEASRDDDLQCADGYTGPTCSLCASHRYRLRQDCLECPNLAWLIFVGFGVGMVSIVAFAYFLNKRRVNLAGLSIGVDFMQIIAMVRSCWRKTCNLFDSACDVSLRDSISRGLTR